MAGFVGFAYLQRGAGDETPYFDFAELPKGRNFARQDAGFLTKQPDIPV
jgi:hypothetical protein